MNALKVVCATRLLLLSLCSVRAVYLNCSVATFSGTATAGFLDGAAPLFNNAVKLAVVPPSMQARLGLVVVADRLNGKLRGVAPNGTAWTVPISGPLLPTNNPTFAVPHEPTSTLFTCDGGVANSRLYQVGADGSLSLAANFTGDLREVVFAAPGLLYAADYTGHRIFSVASADGSGAPGTWGAPAVLSGSGAAGSADGPAAVAQFNNPAGLVLVGGVLFVTEWGGHRVRAVYPSTGAVALFAGSATGAPGYRDGMGAGALFNTPYAICSDGDAFLYLVEYNGARVRRVALANAAVDTLAGTGVQVSPYVNGPGVAATVTNARGIALTAGGQLLFTDQQAVRALTCGAEVGLASATPSPTPSQGATPTATPTPAATQTRSPSPSRTPPAAPCVVSTIAGTGVAGAAVNGCVPRPSPPLPRKLLHPRPNFAWPLTLQSSPIRGVQYGDFCCARPRVSVHFGPK